MIKINKFSYGTLDKGQRADKEAYEKSIESALLAQEKNLEQKVVEEKEKSYAQGMEAGRNIASGEYASTQTVMLTALEEEVKKATSLLQARQGEVEMQIIDIACNIAKKIAAGALSRFPQEEVKSIIRKTLEFLPQQKIKILINPVIAQEVEETIGVLLQNASQKLEYELVLSSEIAPYDVKMQFSGGEIGSIKSKIIQNIDDYFSKNLE